MPDLSVVGDWPCAYTALEWRLSGAVVNSQAGPLTRAFAGSPSLLAPRAAQYAALVQGREYRTNTANLQDDSIGWPPHNLKAATDFPLMFPQFPLAQHLPVKVMCSAYQ